MQWLNWAQGDFLRVEIMTCLFIFLGSTVTIEAVMEFALKNYLFGGLGR